MTGLLPSRKLRSVAALVAAYAVALQAVFVTLAPMQVRADGTVAIYCSGSGDAVTPDGAPAPVTGKLPCVFCGACAGGFAVLPPAVLDSAGFSTVPATLVLPDGAALRVAGFARDGPARAPPPAV
jgi:hypothetical protein